jgi:hypothetical protein
MNSTLPFRVQNSTVPPGILILAVIHLRNAASKLPSLYYYGAKGQGVETASVTSYLTS